MLVLSRDCDTAIRIGPNIKIKVLSIRKQRVKLGVDAPSSVRVWREEIFPEVAGNDPSAQPTASSSPRQQHLSVLVVEDDPEHCELIRRTLSQCVSSTARVASTGKLAMEALGGPNGSGLVEKPPQLVLLDLCLPDMPGLEVLRWIRAHDSLQTMPVVVLSADHGDATVTSCIEAGANAFVGKSVGYREFSESVARIAQFWGGYCRLPKATLETPA